MKKLIKSLLFGKNPNQEKKIVFGIGRGIRMKIDPSSKTQRILGLDEREIQKAFKSFALNAQSYIDIGASDGYYGLIYRKYNPQGQIYLFDLNPTFLQEQKSNFALNGSTDNVFFSSKKISNFSDANNLSLDEMFPDTREKIFFKIDVDGDEVFVLEGIQNLLKRNDCLLIIETHSQQLEKDCVSFLNTLGYKTRIIPNAWWRSIIPEDRPIGFNRWLSAEK